MVINYKRNFVDYSNIYKYMNKNQKTNNEQSISSSIILFFASR